MLWYYYAAPSFCLKLQPLLVLLHSASLQPGPQTRWHAGSDAQEVYVRLLPLGNRPCRKRLGWARPVSSTGSYKVITFMRVYSCMSHFKILKNSSNIYIYNCVEEYWSYLNVINVAQRQINMSVFRKSSYFEKEKKNKKYNLQWCYIMIFVLNKGFPTFVFRFTTLLSSRPFERRNRLICKHEKKNNNNKRCLQQSTARLGAAD